MYNEIQKKNLMYYNLSPIGNLWQQRSMSIVG